MQIKKITIGLFLGLFSSLAPAEETCSRVATVNYQKVLLDTSSTRKGEGLRYLLEKDAQAKSWLDRYQQGTHIQWENALMGTLGTGLLLGGVMTSSSGKRKKSLILGGMALIMVNFLVARTSERANEAHLIKAIEEYNKRNVPKIYLEVELDQNSRSTHLALGGVWEF